MALNGMIFVAALAAAVCLAAPDASAIEVGSAACKREMQATQKMMQDSAALVDSGMNASGAERCKALSEHLRLAQRIRESFARCEEPKQRTGAVRDADEVIEASYQAYNKWCLPRPGLVRVKGLFVASVTRDKLPKPLAAVHDCGKDGAPMFFTNERFDLGRLMGIGCPGNPSPTADEIKARNATADLLSREQVMYYVTRDSDGDDPRRLTFPIFDADGHESATDRLFATRVFVGEKLDLISSFWEPAKDGVCRVHATWRVVDGKAALVYWGEAADCTNGKTEFKTVLDRR